MSKPTSTPSSDSEPPRTHMVVGKAMGMPALNASDGTWASWFRLFVERANDLIYLHDVSGKILYVNRKLEDVTGYRREELVGKDLRSLLGSSSRVSAELRREHEPEDSEQGRRYEVEILCSDGSLVPLEVHSTPLREGNTIIAWQGIARDIRERRRAQARLAAIYETARQLVGILDLNGVLTTIVQRAAEITGAHSCSVWLAEKQDTLRCAAAHNVPAATQAMCIERAASHPIAQALREGRTTFLSAASAVACRVNPGLPPGVTSAICLPLEGAHGAVGVLSLSYTSVLGQDPDELAVLSTFASHAAAAIANARLFEAQRRKTQEAVAIGQIGMTAGAIDAEAALHVTGAYASDLFAADLSAVLVLEEGRARLRVGYVTGPDEDENTARFQEPLPVSAHPLFAEALREQRTIMVEDCAAHPLTSADPLFQGGSLASAIVVPLLSGERALGALLLAYHARATLSDVQIRLAETLAQQAAVAYDNAMMFRRIAAAKQEWEATFNAITDPVCIFSRQGFLLRANNAAATLLKTAPEALLGKHCHTLFYNTPLEESNSVFHECLSQRKPVTREVENLIFPGVFQIAAYPLFESTGEWTGVVEYIKDITAQQQMQAKLYHSARLAGVGELAAGVVHNFKNVLMGISGTLDIAAMHLARDGGNAEVSQRLQEAQAHVYRGNQVLERLLSFARGMPHKITDVSLPPLLSDLVALCKAHPASRGLRINAEMPKDLPSVRADASQLHEVLMNLVLNAMQAMQDRGTVTIRVAAVDSQVRISVADTGCGITPQDLEHIFEPFYSRRASGPPGTGIGLSASLRMVRAMDGDIHVESAVGQGSTFTVVLPAART